MWRKTRMWQKMEDWGPAGEAIYVYEMLSPCIKIVKTPELTFVQACWTSCAFWIWTLDRGPFDQNYLAYHEKSMKAMGLYLMCKTWWINTSMNSVKMSNVKSLSFFDWVSMIRIKCKTGTSEIDSTSKDFKIHKFIVSSTTKACRNWAHDY